MITLHATIGFLQGFLFPESLAGTDFELAIGQGGSGSSRHSPDRITLDHSHHPLIWRRKPRKGFSSLSIDSKGSHHTNSQSDHVGSRFPATELEVHGSIFHQSEFISQPCRSSYRGSSDWGFLSFDMARYFFNLAENRLE